MTRVAVLYGGISNEREVSLSTGRGVIEALRTHGYHVVAIEADADLGAIVRALTEPACVDCVFNALHGRFGEDGAIQGVLDWLGIPYTHSGVRASALAMDKQAAKAVFAAAGLPVAHGRTVDVAELEHHDPIPLPYVVKPVNEGSSVGVEILLRGDNRRAAIARSWRFGPAAMVEEYIPGRELTVAVMGDRALAVTEIKSATRCPPRSTRPSTRKPWTWRSPPTARSAAAAPPAPTSATTTPGPRPAASSYWR